MTKPEQPKSLPLPLLLVFGKPTSPDLPQASWFRVEDRQAVIAAAQALKFSVIDIATEADRALLTGVHEGVLKGAGRMIVGSVAPEVYKLIEEHADEASAARVAIASSAEAARAKSFTEQNKNIPNPPAPPAPRDEKPDTAPTAPDPWAALRVGSHVVAKHWNSDGEADGWWIAVITALDGRNFIIRWPDEPRTPPLKIDRKHIALPHPDFDVAREWDRKPIRRS